MSERSIESARKLFWANVNKFGNGWDGNMDNMPDHIKVIFNKYKNESEIQTFIEMHNFHKKQMEKLNSLEVMNDKE